MSAWETVKLGDLMAPHPGSVDPRKAPDQLFELHSIPAHDRGKPDVVRGHEIGSTKQRVKPDDVLLAKIVPHIRRAHVVGPTVEIDQIASSEWMIFRSPAVNPGYLRHFLIGDTFHSRFMATVAGVGGSLLRARPQYVKKITIPLPPLPEQRRIASILDEADAIRVKRRTQLARIDDLPQALFREMSGAGASRVRNVRLSDVVLGIDSGTSAVCESRPAGPGEWGILKLGAVTYGDFRAIENKAFLGDVSRMMGNTVHSGDVLMTRKNTRELVGAVAIVSDNPPPRLLLPDLIFRLRLRDDQLDPRYFQTLMMSEPTRQRVRNLASGSAASMPNISKSRLRDLRVSLPPLGDQQAFADKVVAIGAERDRVARALEADDELFSALQHRAFRGEL